MKTPLPRTVLLALLMTALFTFPAAAEDPDPIVILHTNDVHCAAEGYPALAAQKQALEEQYGADRVTLVDVGDSIQGSAVGTLSDGAYPVDLMNAVGYDLAVPGNHEFDYGMDVFLDLAENRAAFPYFCANLTGPDGELVFAPYTVVDYGDVQVGYVGVTTPETIGKSTPTHFQDGQGNYCYSFQEGNGGSDFYSAVQSAVDGALVQGADYVVALAHLGMEGISEEFTSASLIANTRGIDLLLDGHSHEVLNLTVQNLDGEEIPLVQTGTKLANLGCVLLDPATGSIEVCPISLEGGVLPRDPEVAGRLAQIQARFEDLLAQNAGRTSVDLIATNADGSWAVRSQETNLGDLVADAYRVLLGADAGLVNGGGVRADIPAGEITYGDLLNVQPFANELCLVEISGQELLDLLEYGVQSYPESNGSFFQVSGLTFTFDPSIPSSVVVSERDEFLGVDGPYRVSDVMVGGRPLELNKTYTLASHNYLIKSGGSGGTMLLDNKLLLDCVMLDSEALMDYVSHSLDGQVGEEYSQPNGQGRITVLSQSSQSQTPAPVGPTYQVQAGDCLWRIAARQLGSGSRWMDIYKLNQNVLTDPDRIYPGQQLTLPAA